MEREIESLRERVKKLEMLRRRDVMAVSNLVKQLADDGEEEEDLTGTDEYALFESDDRTRAEMEARLEAKKEKEMEARLEAEKKEMEAMVKPRRRRRSSRRRGRRGRRRRRNNLD